MTIRSPLHGFGVVILNEDEETEDANHDSSPGKNTTLLIVILWLGGTPLESSRDEWLGSPNTLLFAWNRGH